jgi:hypothetical protein
MIPKCSDSEGLEEEDKEQEVEEDENDLTLVLTAEFIFKFDRSLTEKDALRRSIWIVDTQFISVDETT